MSGWREKLNGRRVVASISGGKDSAALGLWLKEQDVDPVHVFADTKWETDALYDHLRGHLARSLGTIHEACSARYPGGMEDLVRAKEMFPTRKYKFCTDHLKVQPIQEWVDAYRERTGEDVVIAVGVRAEESEDRARMPEWEWSERYDAEIWRPLIRWTEADVVDIHRRHGLPPCDLYLRGHRRVGCYPCIQSTKEEIRLVALHAPERIALIRELESVVQAGCARKIAERGEAVEGALPTFFRGKGAVGPMAIDEVVRWARTSRGGRQVELFTPDYGDVGCVRWGLCEADNKEAA